MNTIWPDGHKSSRQGIQKRTGQGPWKSWKKIKNLWICLLTLLCACSLSGCAAQAEETVRVIYYDSTQSEVMAQLLCQVLDDAGIHAQAVKADGYKDMQPAIMGGTVDMYVDYTSRAWMETLNHRDEYRSNDYPALLKGYQDLGLTWLPLPHIIGTQTVAVHINVVEELGLKTMSDLAEHASKLRLGADLHYMERKDGLPLLENGYQMEFKTTQNISEEEQYDRISERKVDVIPVNSIDARLLGDRIVMLEDDQHLLPQFTGGIVIRSELLEVHPHLYDYLYTRTRNITGENLQIVSAMVQQNGTPSEKAAEFLLEKSESHISLQ